MIQYKQNLASQKLIYLVLKVAIIQNPSFSQQLNKNNSEFAVVVLLFILNVADASHDYSGGQDLLAREYCHFVNIHRKQVEDVRQETVEVMHAFEQSCLPLEKEHVQVGRSKAKLCDGGHELLGKTRVVDDRVVHDEAASMLLLVQHPVLRHFLQRHTQILRHRPQQLQTQLRDLYALAEAAARNYLQHLP